MSPFVNWVGCLTSCYFIPKLCKSLTSQNIQKSKQEKNSMFIPNDLSVCSFHHQLEFLLNTNMQRAN